MEDVQEDRWIRAFWRTSKSGLASNKAKKGWDGWIKWEQEIVELGSGRRSSHHDPYLPQTTAVVSGFPMGDNTTNFIA